MGLSSSEPDWVPNRGDNNTWGGRVIMQGIGLIIICDISDQRDA